MKRIQPEAEPNMIACKKLAEYYIAGTYTRLCPDHAKAYNAGNPYQLLVHDRTLKADGCPCAWEEPEVTR